MEVKRRLIEDLTLDPRNARTHSQKNLDAIAASLTKFGQRKPIVITSDGVVLAGNGTLEAAKSLGWDHIDVSVTPADWDIDTARAYALADNRTAELAEWDEAILAQQLLELHDADFDIEALGFEMPQVIEPEPIDEDELPLQPEAMVKHGDLWKLGEHLLFCGDATEVGAYERMLGEDQVDLVWTDPPYGVSYVGQGGMTIENDNLDIGALEEFLRQSFNAMFSFTKPGACWYVAAPSGNLFQAFSIPLSELEVWRHTLVWVKDALVMGRADYHYRHESIFYGWTPGAAHQEPPDRKQDSVWEVPRPRSNKEHPTMKPIELITRAINNSSRANDLVLDPFAGSGSTLIAAEQTRRRARVMEIDPKYCDVIIARWERITGGKAELLPGA
jgi:site-specific DNA-methyltransferase (adenine-specific)